MFLRRVPITILAILAMAVGVAQAQTTVSVRDTSARQIDTVLVPFDLSGVAPSDSIFGVQATLVTGTPAVKILGVQSTGTLSAGASVLFNTTTSKLAIAFTSPLSTNGVLLYLKVAVNGTGGSSYSIPITGLLVNEGTPAATADNGSLYIRYVSVQPHAPATVVLGDTVQFTVNGNPVLPLTWSSSAPGVGTIDGTGKFVALTEGVLRVRVVDSEGKRDSSDQFTVHPTNLLSLTTSIPDTSQVQTLQIGIPVRVSSVTGLGITSAQFTLTYNATYLQYVSSTALGTLTESWNSPTVNPSVSGTIQFALAGATELSGSGPIIFVRFLVKTSTITTSAVNLSNVQFNEGINSAVDNGIFSPLPAPTIFVTPDRYTALKGQTVTVVSTINGSGPYTYSSSNPSIGSVNPSTGSLTVLTRGPVRILVSDGQGFPGSSDTIRTYDFVASLPDTGFLPPDSIDVPLVIGNTTGLNISAFEFRVAYDTTVVKFRGVITSGGLSSGYAVDSRDSASVIRVAGAGANSLSGSGKLLSLRFAAQLGAVIGDSSHLGLSNFRFNEPGVASPTALAVSGSVKIKDPSTSVSSAQEVPQLFRMDQNYPNPFNPSTTIRFALPTAGSVRLEVFNVLGQSVSVLREGLMQPGFHNVTWHANVPSGIYLYRIEVQGADAKKFVQVRRMILIR